MNINRVEIPIEDGVVRMRDLRDLIEATDNLPEDTMVYLDTQLFRGSIYVEVIR